MDPSYESKRLSRSLSRKIKENKSISRGARVDDMSNYSPSMPTNGVIRSDLTEFLRSSSISSLHDNNNSSSTSTTGTSSAGSSSVVGTPLRPNGIGNNNIIAPLTTPARVRNSSSTTTNSDFSVSPTMMETCFAPPCDLPSVRLRILDPPTTVLPISGSGLTSTSLNGFNSCTPVPSRPTLSKLPIPALDKLPTASTCTSSFDPINTQKSSSNNSNSSYSFRSGSSYPHNSKLAAIPTPTYMAADAITNSTATAATATTVASFKGGNASKATKSSGSSSSSSTIITTSSTNTISTIPVSATAPPPQRAMHELMMMGAASSAQTSLSNEQYNDILLQERLHEAKAMIRKSESGAVMHKFTLWNKVSKEASNDSSGSVSIISVDASAVMEQSSTAYQSAAAAASTDEERERENSLLSLDAPIMSEATTTVQDQSTSSSSIKESPPLRDPSSLALSLATTSSSSAIEHQGPKKKLSKVRGPKVAIKVNRGIHRDNDTDIYRSDEVSHHAHTGTHTSSALVYPSLGNSSTGITAAVVSLVTTSCDVDDEIEEEVKEPRSRSGSGYMMSSSGGLASSLRSKVVVAKQMSSSTSLNTIDSAVAVVDSMMMDACDGRTSNAADSSPDVFEPINELTELQNYSNDGDGNYYEISDEYDDNDDENESLSSVEEDEELRRYYMSRRKSMDDISIQFNEIDFDQNSVVHAMSQSGPATFANYSKSNPALSIQQQQHGQSLSSSMTNHSGKDIHVSNNDATSTAAAAVLHHNGNDNHRMMRRINSNESITNSIIDETLRRESITTMAFRSSNELLLPSLPTSTHTINSGSSSAISINTPLEHISNSNLTKSTSKYEKLKNLRANSARKKDSIHEGVVTKQYEDAHEALSEDEHHVAIKPYDHTSQVKVMSSHSIVPVEKIPLTYPISNSSISREDDANSPTLSELSDIDELSVVHNINNNNNNNNNNNRNMYGYNNENHNINNNNNNNIIASHINNFKDQLDTTSSHTHHHVSHHLMESTSNRHHYDNNVIHSKETHGDAVVGVTDRDSAGMESPPLQWRKGEVIGEGTFGKVFKGLNERTGELIAIKQLCLFDSSDSKEIQSLRKEISVMWNLEHENIVRYVCTHIMTCIMS